ncbi:MAG: acetyltransferase [Muribaculaceae bacterium]|nr:acetyltransferase [Muribaculaceae bacterium]
MNIAIYGAGGFGKEVACLINRINRNGGDWQLIGFFDDTKPVGSAVSRYGKVLGGMDTLMKVDEPLAIAIAINDNKVVRRIRESITNVNISFPNLIDPSLFMVDDQTFTIGEGNIIQNDCMISCDVEMGNFNLINDHVVVGHDNKIGDFNGLMPAAHLSGGITIGDNNLLGVASVVLQGMTIGNGVTLGANSVLMTQPRDNSTYLGVPAKRFDF